MEPVLDILRITAHKAYKMLIDLFWIDNMEKAEWNSTHKRNNSGYLRKKFNPDGAIQKGHWVCACVSKAQMIIRK